MNRGAALVASLLVTLGRPAWWLLALASFLVRGGFVLFLLPIVVLPSPLALSNLVGPLVVAIAFGRIDADVIVVTGAAAGVLLGWLLAGGWLAATIELALLREVADAAADEGVGVPGVAMPPGSRVGGDRGVVGRMLAARLLASVPLAIAIGFGSVGVIAVTYAELTRPSEVAAPLVARVALGAAAPLAVIVAAWCIAEVVGGFACRRIALAGTSVGRGLFGAARDLVIRPRLVLLPWLVTTAWFLAVVAAALLAAAVAWSRLLAALSVRLTDPATAVIALVTFVAIWLAALVLTGLFAAIRSSAMTFQFAARLVNPGPDNSIRASAQVKGPGTFGASAHHRPGDWSVDEDGGSL
jgi:hypothetical protein